MQSHLSAATVLEDGYDSDARQNHNAAIEMEGPQELDEPELGEVLDPSSPSDNQAEESETSNNQPEFVLIPNNMITKMKVADLKAELSKSGLDMKGLKNVLLDHLKQAMADKVVNCEVIMKELVALQRQQNGSHSSQLKNQLQNQIT